MKNFIRSALSLLAICLISWLVSNGIVLISLHNESISKLLTILYLIICTPISVYAYEKICSKDKISKLLGGVIVLIYNAVIPCLYVLNFFVFYTKQNAIFNFLFNSLNDPLLYLAISIIISMILSVYFIYNSVKNN